MKRRNFLWCSCLFVAGCSGATKISPAANSSSVSLPTTLRFAVTDAKGLEELQTNYEPFRVALAEVLQTAIEFFPVEDPFMAVSALQSNQLDLVWAGPSEYVTIHSRTKAAPIVSLTRPGYHTVIAVRADGGIKSLIDLKGKTIDMWWLGSNAAHLGGTKLLLDAGLDPTSDFQVIMSADDSLKPLKSGEADAWARPAHKYRNALQAENASEQEYPLIAQGAQLPGDIFVLSSYLETAITTEIQSRMLNSKAKLLQAIASVESLAAKFPDAELNPANDADYDMIREVYRAIGQGEFIQ